VFEENNVVNPSDRVFRILQETRLEGFPPCRNVVVRGNVMVFRRAGLRAEVNVGDGTAPEIFRFERNWWFAEDDPQRSRMALAVVAAGLLLHTSFRTATRINRRRTDRAEQPR